MRPTLYLSNLASARSEGHHGPSGRVFHAMARPRPFEVEHTLGRVVCLTPHPRVFDTLKRGQIEVPVYRFEVERTLITYHIRRRLGVGSLAAYPAGVDPRHVQSDGVLLADGDTVVCGCARWEPGRKRRHPCHLELTPAMLVAAGWDVVLWGRRLTQRTLTAREFLTEQERAGYDGDLEAVGGSYVAWADPAECPDPEDDPPFVAPYAAGQLGWPEPTDDMVRRMEAVASTEIARANVERGRLRSDGDIALALSIGRSDEPVGQA